MAFPLENLLGVRQLGFRHCSGREVRTLWRKRGDAAAVSGWPTRARGLSKLTEAYCEAYRG